MRGGIDMRVRLILEYDVESSGTLAEAVAAEQLTWKSGDIEVSDILNMDESTHPILRVEAVEDKT